MLAVRISQLLLFYYMSKYNATDIFDKIRALFGKSVYYKKESKKYGMG